MEKFLMTGNSSEQSLALSIMSHLFSQKLPNMKILIKTFLLVNSAHEDSRTEVVKVLTNLAKHHNSNNMLTYLNSLSSDDLLVDILIETILTDGVLLKDSFKEAVENGLKFMEEQDKASKEA